MNEAGNNWPAGIKRTRQRVTVLAILENSGQPLSAADICSKIETNKEAAWLSTVYRILEVFVRKGMVLKTTVLNEEAAVYELNRLQHKYYAVCMNCRRIITMDHCELGNFIPQLAEQDFQVMGHTLEVFGFCKDCNPN